MGVRASVLWAMGQQGKSGRPVRAWGQPGSRPSVLEVQHDALGCRGEG